jgi:hypothetical protein
MRLVANGTTGRAEPAHEDDCEVSATLRERRHLVPDAGSKDLFERQKDIDYLDIPSFLRTQAD